MVGMAFAIAHCLVGSAFDGWMLDGWNESCGSAGKADAESIFYQPGDKITVGFNNKALHIFDKEKKTNLYYND